MPGVLNVVQPLFSLDFGQLIWAAYQEDALTVEEDLGLGVDNSVLQKRPPSPDDLQTLPQSENAQSEFSATRTAKLPPLNPDNTKKKSHQTWRNAKRTQKRRKKAAESTPLTRTASNRTREEYVQLSEPMQAPSSFTTADMAAMNGAYKARQEDAGRDAKKLYHSLEEFQEKHPDFQVFPWNGREATPILDSNGKICVTLCGQPNDPTYRESTYQAYQAMLKATDGTNFRRKDRAHRRGGFPALNIGVTYGIGHDEPKFLKTEPYTDMLWDLLGNEHVRRLASYASSAFQLWQPKVYNYYAARLDKLWKHAPGLSRIFGDCSVYPCAAFNFARNVWCYKHRDVMNCPFGFCAITALGDFDPKKGGHLVLWELKMIVEFPHGSTILVPSATITHSNIPVQQGDIRLSFTQFCAGGLFQYIDSGFSTETNLKKTNPGEYERLQHIKPLNWEAGLNLIATMDDVKWN